MTERVDDLAVELAPELLCELDRRDGAAGKRDARALVGTSYAEVSSRRVVPHGSTGRSG